MSELSTIDLTSADVVYLLNQADIISTNNELQFQKTEVKVTNIKGSAATLNATLFTSGRYNPTVVSIEDSGFAIKINLDQAIFKTAAGKVYVTNDYKNPPENATKINAPWSLILGAGVGQADAANTNVVPKNAATALAEYQNSGNGYTYQLQATGPDLTKAYTYTGSNPSPSKSFPQADWKELIATVLASLKNIAGTAAEQNYVGGLFFGVLRTGGTASDTGSTTTMSKYDPGPEYSSAAIISAGSNGEKALIVGFRYFTKITYIS